MGVWNGAHDIVYMERKMAGGEKVDMENAGKHRGWMLSGISFQSADGGIRTRLNVHIIPINSALG